jgi:hypothetical protein
MVRAGLEGDVQRCTTSLHPSLTQGHGFSVRLAEAGVPTIRDHRIARNDDGANHWVGRRLSPSFFCVGERSRHPLPIERPRHATNLTS